MTTIDKVFWTCSTIATVLATWVYCGVIQSVDRPKEYLGVDTRDADVSDLHTLAAWESEVAPHHPRVVLVWMLNVYVVATDNNAVYMLYGWRNRDPALRARLDAARVDVAITTP